MTTVIVVNIILISPHHHLPIYVYARYLENLRLVFSVSPLLITPHLSFSLSCSLSHAQFSMFDVRCS